MSQAVSLHEVINELEREHAMRQRVFPKWVAAGRLKQTDSDHRIACIATAKAILVQIAAQGEVTN